MARLYGYSRELRERAVVLVFEQVGRYSSQWDPIRSIASKVG
jgi:transposase